MADTKISDLTEDATPDLVADFFASADMSAGASKKVRPSSILGPAPGTETGTPYVFALADAFKTKVFDSASAQAIEIPPNGTIAFPIGTRIRCYRKGTGLPTISPGSGVTLNKPTGIEPPVPVRAKVGKSGDQTGVDYTSVTAIAWNNASAEYDEDYAGGAWWSSGANTRLTAPAHVVAAQFFSQVRLANITASTDVLLDCRRDGTDIIGLQRGISSTTNPSLSLSTPEVDVSGGKYMETRLTTSADTSIDVTANRSFFGVRATKINPLGCIAYRYGFVTIEKIGTNEWIIYGPALG
jgi:hypothetical protein